MDFVSRPTLVHMSQVKIAIELWNRDDFSWKDFNWLGFYLDNMEKKAIKKAQNLPLPNRLKNVLTGDYIRQTGLQLSQWFQYLRRRYEVSRRNPTELRWTSAGTIDARKSAEIVLLDPSVAVANRFEIACDYCFEEHIGPLWSRLTTRQQCDYTGRKSAPLIHFWSWQCMFRRSPDNNNTETYKHGFRLALKNSNAAAAKHFYRLLVPKGEQQWALSMVTTYRRSFPSYEVETFTRERWADILCFFLSEMSESQRAETLKTRLKDVLSYFLVWPYQSLFLETLDRGMWEFLSEGKFFSLLPKIFSRINYSYEDCVYRSIFREFWQSAPEASRKHVIARETDVCKLLDTFFNAGEEDLCRLMLKDLSCSQKEELLKAAAAPPSWVYGVPFSNAALTKGDKRKDFIQFLENLSPGSAN